ncbi:LAGLIDADG family homing endonuclease [Alkalihalophilus lindianensis]|uniref:LAGLIDADG family homing endonuclease n=1 Tax=Alkalihalophilus lindianensis TaxID=1630542 RepID=UPI0034DF6584
MKADLIHLHGIKPNKFNTVEFPNVPDEYMSHFLRGYFDGDGHVNYKKYQVSFVCGSELFMNSLTSVLTRNSINNFLTSNGKYFRIYNNGRRSINV